MIFNRVVFAFLTFTISEGRRWKSKLCAGCWVNFILLDELKRSLLAFQDESCKMKEREEA
jgi:hypothetical protein